MILLLTAVATCLLLLLWILLLALTPTPRPRLQSECYYRSAKDVEKAEPLGSLQDDASLSISVIVPAFNETERLPIMLKEALEHLERRKARQGQDKGSYEILVIDDGSTDQTIPTALQYAKDATGQGGEHIKVVALQHNRGKGGAVTHGMLFASGKLLLFADADGATRFSDLDLLEQGMSDIETEGHGFVVGSRAHMVNTEAVVQRSPLRNLLMRSFHLYLHLLGISSVKDTQCGFKLFTRASARLIFPLMHVERWIFDIELLLLAMMAHIPVLEVPVTWKEVEGSKMQLMKDSIAMAIDLLIIRTNYTLGRWQQPPDIRKVA